MPTKIISIHGRSETGVSRPFLCEDENGRSFFVKRDNVTWDQLVLEFVMGSLASGYGIAVAPFEVLEIPELLSQQVLAKDRQDFCPGLAFASQRIPFGEDLIESHSRQVDAKTKRAIICFDWWTRNSDRRMSFGGAGCPNLMWDPLMQNVVAIDHDNCLDYDFDAEEFKREHAFRDVLPFLERDQLEKLRVRFDSSIYSLDKIWETVPGDWLKDEETGETRSKLTMHDIEAALLAPQLPVDGILPG